MTNKICDSPIHKVSSLALAFIILVFCVLPSFAKADSVYPNEPVGWKDGDTFRDILLVVLDSWGISFSKSDSSDTTSILEYSDELMEQFYEDNNTTQELFWDLVHYGASETGNIILDFLGVNKIRQFANWLKDKFSLTNNSSIPTVPASNFAYVGNTKCLVLNSPSDLVFVNYLKSSNLEASWLYNLYVYADVTAYPIYLTTFRVGDNFYRPAVYSPNGFQNLYFRNSVSHSITLSVNSGTVINYFMWPSNRYMSVPVLDSLQFSSEPTIVDIFGDFTITPISSGGSSLVINTTVINIPSDDLDPDDGMEIEIPGTNWGDSIYTILNIIERLIGLYDSTQLNINTVIELISTLLQGLQQSVSVENIPGAVILDYDDYDIPLENEWGLFDIFYDSGGDSDLVLSPWQGLRSIIFGFPAPILSYFALVVLFIVAYGFIRMGRDSH